jgi:hypothetical protein
VQLSRAVNLWVRSDDQGRNIRPYMEIGDALRLMSPFVITEVNMNGERLVALRTGESIAKFEICKAEGHVVLKLGEGTAAIAAGQVQSCHSQSGCTAVNSVLSYQVVTAQAVGPLRYPSASNSDHRIGIIACALWC